MRNVVRCRPYCFACQRIPSTGSGTAKLRLRRTIVSRTSGRCLNESRPHEHLPSRLNQERGIHGNLLLAAGWLASVGVALRQSRSAESTLQPLKIRNRSASLLPYMAAAAISEAPSADGSDALPSMRAHQPFGPDIRLPHAINFLINSTSPTITAPR